MAGAPTASAPAQIVMSAWENPGGSLKVSRTASNIWPPPLTTLIVIPLRLSQERSRVAPESSSLPRTLAAYIEETGGTFSVAAVV